MLRIAPALLLAATASAATVTLDSFTQSQSTTGFSNNNGITSDTLANGTVRSISATPWAAGTVTLGISNGTLVANSGSAYSARVDYNFASSLSLLGGAASSADSSVGLHVSTTSSAPVVFSVWFFNNQYEASGFWQFSAAANSSALYSASLASIDAGFPWEAVDFIRIEFGTTASGSVTLGGDGLGFRAGTAPAPVPEPSTYGIVLGGLALAGAVVRRRRAGR